MLSPKAVTVLSASGPAVDILCAANGGGVHVEVEPFGPARTAGKEVGAANPDRTNSYVEFDAPQNMEPTAGRVSHAIQP
jgi:hypothetical protein